MAAENTLSSSLSFTPQTNIKITSLTIVVASIFLFLTIIFLFLLYLYFKHHWRTHPTSLSPPLPSSPPPLAPNRGGLPPSLLTSLPITLYNPADFPDGIECAVCLSELAAGEEARLLPKCGHGFHLDCIDAWFCSNSTCPVCRCAVEEDGSEGASASSERMLLPMISVEVRSAEGISLAYGGARAQAEEKRSLEMWSFRRILSRGTCPSPRVGDIERGMGGSGAHIGEGSLSSPV